MTPPRSTLLSILLATLASACANTELAKASEPELDCAAQEIMVSEVDGQKAPGGALSWVASCGERRWLCSRLDTRALCDEIPVGVELDFEQK